MNGHILTLENKKEERILRTKARAFDFKNHDRKEINGILTEMRKAMHKAQGIGFAANQIGFDFAVFIAEIPAPGGGNKLYTIFNPKIEKAGSEKIPFEEGCLSVPGIYGEVMRSDKITLSGFDKNNRPIKIKAWGLLARVFQHELDHLNGFLFIDRTKKLHRVEKINSVANT